MVEVLVFVRYAPNTDFPDHIIVEKHWVGELLYVRVDTPDFKGFRVRGKLPSGEFIYTFEVPYEGQSLEWFIEMAELRPDVY